jgi:hypothetical protein
MRPVILIGRSSRAESERQFARVVHGLYKAHERNTMRYRSYENLPLRRFAAIVTREVVWR